MSLDLINMNCPPASTEVEILEENEQPQYLAQLTNWKIRNNALVTTRHFKNFQETMAFVNAIASIANQQDHHPELLVTYNTCTIHYITHSVDALTLNDFICAAKINFITDSIDSNKNG